jgi:hypothetical protein
VDISAVLMLGEGDGRVPVSLRVSLARRLTLERLRLYFCASAFWVTPAWYSLTMAARSALVRRRLRAQGLPFDERAWAVGSRGRGQDFGRSP